MVTTVNSLSIRAEPAKPVTGIYLMMISILIMPKHIAATDFVRHIFDVISDAIRDVAITKVSFLVIASLQNRALTASRADHLVVPTR